MKSQTRLFNLDYLRGIAAFGIMIYHCFGWAYGSFPIDSFMAKVGVYAVGIFYILSGLTLYYVYFDRLSLSYDSLKNFFLKRFFRIFPLLWLVIFLKIGLSGQMPSLYILGLNLTGLFGLIKWDAYIGTGVWSIGNELVFYLFFPVFVFLARSNKLLFHLLSALLTAIFFYFAYFKLDINHSLDDQVQWSMYINPLNQVFLFLSGFLMGYYFSGLKLNSIINALIFMVGFGAFVLFVPQGDNLGAGINRIFLTASCFVICFSFYKNTVHLPAIADRGLRALGEASYSVYLLHPLIWQVLKGGNSMLSLGLSDSVRLAMTIVFTLVFSYLNYRIFESYFIKLGNNILKKASTKTQPAKDLAA